MPVFNPFLMAVLLVCISCTFATSPCLSEQRVYQIFKIISPYIILAMCLHLLNRRLHLPPFSLFLVAVTLTDGVPYLALTSLCETNRCAVITMTFFFNVTDTGTCIAIAMFHQKLTRARAGSWLEIGQSITFFVISSLLLVWAAGTCAVGELLMANDDTLDQKKAKSD